MKRNSSKQAEQKSQVEKVDSGKTRVARVLLEMENCIVYPYELLEPLAMAIALDSKRAFGMSVDEIKLYEMYDPNEPSFLGSFYALEYNGRYYGNIVGSRQIISCSPNAFHFVKTEKLFVPLRTEGENIFVMVCHYTPKKSQSIEVERLEKRRCHRKTLKFCIVLILKRLLKRRILYGKRNF